MIFKNRILLGLICILTVAICSCDKYNFADELQSLGKRVEILEDSVLIVNNKLKANYEALSAIEISLKEPQNDSLLIDKITDNGDGSYTITYHNGEVYVIRQGKTGKDAIEAGAVIGIDKYTDGNYYWIIIYADGTEEWLKDNDGNMMRASGTDGKSLEDQGGNIPLVRINGGVWELSTDGGKTWRSMGVKADGENGVDAEDIIASIEPIKSEGSSVIDCIKITLTNGEVYIISISSYSS